MPIYKTSEELTNLQVLEGLTQRISDLRKKYFGSARRSEIIAKINTITGGTAIYWHDAWEEFLRSQSINNSKYIEEERGVFHKTSTYP